MLEHTRSASASSPLLDPPIPPFAKARRPSLSNAMSWLHKSSNSTSSIGPYAPKSLQISEPKLTGSQDKLPASRLGPLGSGATIVSTPLDALTAVGARPVPQPLELQPHPQARPPTPKKPLASGPRSVERLVEEEEQLPPSPRNSPPLPPIPVPWQTSARSSAGSSSRGSGFRSVPPQGPPPTGALPMTPDGSPTRSSFKLQRSSGHSTRSRSVGTSSSAPRNSEHHQTQHLPPVPSPSLPLELLSAPEQPEFDAVLLSDLPANLHRIDSSKVIVVLETATSSYKSTLKTLSSRPSNLKTYLAELVSSTNTTPPTPSFDTPTEESEKDGDSLYSQKSEFHDSDVDDDGGIGFNNLFRDHFATKVATSSKPKPKRRADSSAVIHIFLDRPSSSYAHIMSYMRSPVVPDQPGNLPYSARFLPHRTSFSSSRIESLLELRDEAAYLGLNELEKLCNEELTTAALPSSQSNGQQQRSSVQSTHTLIEPEEQDRTVTMSTKDVEQIPLSPSSTAVDVPPAAHPQQPFKFPAAQPLPLQNALQFRASSKSPTRRSRGRDREALPPRMMSTSEYI